MAANCKFDEVLARGQVPERSAAPYGPALAYFVAHQLQVALPGRDYMRNAILTAVISIGLISGSVVPSAAATHRTRAQQAKHRRHMKTAKRVGVGAVGGTVGGAIVGHPVAGAAVGAAAGAAYDHHKKKHGK